MTAASVVVKTSALGDDDAITIPTRQIAIPPGKPGKSSTFEAEWMTMTLIHIRRKIKHPTSVMLTLSAYVFISLMISFIWFQLPNSPEAADAAYRVITLQSFFYTVFSNLNGYTAFHIDRQHYLPNAKDPKARQQFSPVAVWFGKYQSEMPFRVFLCILTCSMIYPIVGLRPGFYYYLGYQLAFLVQVFANGAFGMNISAIFADPLLGAWGAFSINFFNYLFNLTSVPPFEVTWILRWLSFLSVSFYIDQMLIANQFSGATYPGYLITGDEILSRTGWLVLNYWGALIGGIGLAVLSNITGPLLLYLTTRPSRLTK